MMLDFPELFAPARIVSGRMSICTRLRYRLETLHGYLSDTFRSFFLTCGTYSLLLIAYLIVQLIA